MQPLLRHLFRSPFNNILASIAPRAPLSSTTSSVQVSTCIQCRFRAQIRHFADDTKPKSPSKASDSSPSPSSEHASPSPPTHELPSARETRRSPTAKRLSSLMDNLQGNIFIASQRLNDLTGYSGIEALKSEISTLESHLASCQDAVRSSRLAYKTTVADRAASQREVTTLLARKDTWTPADLERFTSLYRSDHGNEQAVQEAATRLADCERIAEQAASKLSSSILSRYHEEQIWSDKIRRMSTWGTWGLMGVNVLLFFVFQFGFEPWRRARLVRGFEEKVKEALEREKQKQLHSGGAVDTGTPMTKTGGHDQESLDGVVAAGIEELEEEMNDSPKNADPAIDAVATVIRSNSIEGDKASKPEGQISTGALRRPERWKLQFFDLFSDRVVSLSRHDITIIALEGAATGATLASLVAMFVLRPK